MMRLCSLLLWQLTVRLAYQLVTAGQCLSGSDVFASVTENSPSGRLIAQLNISGEVGSAAVRLCLSGTHADWFYLEGRTVRLNSSLSRVLDREVVGPLLIAELTCYEDDITQSRFRIVVEILNQNDNKPRFLEDSLQAHTLSELTAVDSVVFTVAAADADGDMITYIIDQSWPDASYFRIDLPNSGNVVLDKPLDYETRTRLQLLIWAEEANSEEKFNASAVLTVHVADGDDQYPHFLPCTPVSPGLPVCTNPTYSANITDRHQRTTLDFSPGPIRAQDGDRGIDAALSYSILSGSDSGRFVIDSRTGEVQLTRGVTERRLTPSFRLTVMASQVDDPLKYSLALVLVRVLCENRFPPVFNRTTYKGFIIQNSSPASIVSTYGHRVLLLQAWDQDFPDGLNPNMAYWLQPRSVGEGLYHVTQRGVVIARSDRLRAFDRHILQVVARDEESGEEASASVDIEVLQRGQAVPRGALTEEQLFGEVDSRLAGGVAAAVLLLVLSAVVLALLRAVRRRQRGATAAAEAAAQPGATSRRKQLGAVRHTVNSSAFANKAFSHDYESSRPGSFHGKHGVYTRRQSLPAAPPPSSSFILIDAGGGGSGGGILFPVAEQAEVESEEMVEATAGGGDITEAG